MGEEAGRSAKSQPTRFNDILVVQTAFLGDVLLGIPLLKSLRQLAPSGRLVLVCRKGIGSFFIDAELVDEVIEVDKSAKKSWGLIQKNLETRKFDLLICPHESFRTMLFVSRLNAKIKIGYRRFFNYFAFDHRVSRALHLPEALRQLALLEPLESSWSHLLTDFASRQSAPGGQGLDGTLTSLAPSTSMNVPSLSKIRFAKFRSRAVDSNGEIVASEAPVARVVEPFADAADPVIVLAPGSVWATKMWTKAGFIETGRALAASRGAITVVMGSKDERRLCDEIANAIPNAVSLAGRTTLFESAQLLAVADLLVCNDSGAMHLGAAAGVPIVSVFGPTVLEFGYRPWSDRAEVVQTPLVCRPCGKHGADRCPLGTHDCMKKINAVDVLAAVDRVTR